MMIWVLGFLILALIAGILGFGGIAAQGSSLARLCFLVFLAGFLISGVLGFVRRKRIPPRGVGEGRSKP